MGSSNTIYIVAGTFYSCGSANGSSATSGQLADPQQILVSVSGGTTTLTTPQWSSENIRQFTLTYKAGVPQPGALTTIAGTGSEAYCGDGGPAIDACFNHPYGVAADSSGNLYIGDGNNDRVRKITKSTGNISTIAGWGYNGNTITTYSDPADLGTVPATGLSLYQPTTVSAIPGTNHVYIGGGATTSAVYELNTGTGEAVTTAGNGIPGFAGDGSAANGSETEVNFPQAEAVDSKGNIYIADNNNCAIREISASTGDITTIAGGSSGHLNGCGYGGDNGPATSAQLNAPNSVAIDASGNLYVSEWNNCDVRKIVLSSGVITTIAGGSPGHLNGCGFNGDYGLATQAQLNRPNDVSLDAAEDLYITDNANNRIRKVDLLTGIITTIAGNGGTGYSGDGVATQNSLYNPGHAFSDPNGNVFIADGGNDILRWVDPAGTMVTFAGTHGVASFTGDDGLATAATMNSPSGITQDSEGNFYAADYNNGRVRKITPFAGYGRSTASLDFAEEQQVGTTSGYEQIFLSAIGPVTINSIAVTAGATSFSEIDDCGGNALTAGETCEIDVYFTPTKGGITKGTLTISSNAFFNGTGGLSAQGNTVTLIGNGVGLTASGPLDYPTQLVGQSSTQTVTITNSGALVKIEGLSVPGTPSFTVTGGTCKVGATLATGASCTIVVTFDPVSAGVKKYALAVANNGAASPLLVSLEGTGTQLTVSPTSLAFGTVSTGTTKTLDLTVTNSTGSYTIAPTLSGTGFTILTTGNTCTAAIPAGGSCTLPVQFAPTSATSYSGTLTLAPAAGAASPTVALSGTGQTTAVSTTTTLTSTPNPSTAGQAVTLKATVTAASGPTPTGTVDFYHTTTLLGSGTLSGGVATFSTSKLTAGTWHIDAVYVGNSTDATSTSATIAQVVNN